MKQNMEKLALWQSRLQRCESAYGEELGKMDEREALYRGEQTELRPVTEGDRARDGSRRKARHLRNIVAENVESQVSSTIPLPKVTAHHKRDEVRARIVEDMLRAELQRLPFAAMNDQMERTVPIQGGGFWLVEWDNTLRGPDTVGDVVVTALHPKQVIPQDGIYSGIQDMDYVFLKLPQTKAYVKRRYGVDVAEETEAEPEIKGLDGETECAEELVTQYVVYFRNNRGGIGRFSWVGDTVLEDMEDYQARRLRRCADCGSAEPTAERCPICGGSRWTTGERDGEDIFVGFTTAMGRSIPGAAVEWDEQGKTLARPNHIPFFAPAVYPLILQKNVSVYGRFLGGSDVDKIKDQQNTINRMEQKIIDRLVKAGTRITLPDRADFRVDAEDGERWYIGNAADKALIGSYDFSGNLQYEMAFTAQVYEEARQALGITDSFQGRRDATAQSGVAKQFAAAQSAGRLESKRVLKNAAYAELFRLIFQTKLAYADEPRPVTRQNERGEIQYEAFDRYDFLEKDGKGEWYWNDQFFFACDVTAPLANNRERMWETTGAHFRSGAYGNPAELDTLLLYWTRLEALQYPGAADTKTALEQRKTGMEALRQNGLPNRGGDR